MSVKFYNNPKIPNIEHPIRIKDDISVHLDTVINEDYSIEIVPTIPIKSISGYIILSSIEVIIFNLTKNQITTNRYTFSTIPHKHCVSSILTVFLYG